MAVTREQFIQNLNVSGLMSSDEVAAFQASLAEVPTDGETLARLLVRQRRLTVFQAKQIYSGKGKSLVLGNYVLLDKLGQGGMGMVLKAEHRRMKRLVALKVLSPQVTKTPEALRRFQREVEAAARLRHPNIVAADDADEANGIHFLVMEYVEGSDLSALVKTSGALPPDKAVHCVIQAARGLEYAHNRGVVHRDIKPANLLLDTEGTVKILDMGLARLDSAGAQQEELTGTDQIMGTVEYMAPEQAVNPKHADARADIYSLGVTLWYLLTGRAMHAGETAMEKLMAHQSNPIPPLVEHCPAATPALQAVFEKMVARTPPARYQTMTEVIAALEGCRDGADSAPPVAVGAGEDTRLHDFLHGTGSPAESSRQAVAGERAAAQVIPIEEMEATIGLRRPQIETDPDTQQALPLPLALAVDPATARGHGAIAASPKRRAGGGKRKKPPKMLIAVAAALALLSAGAVLFFRTPDDGTLRVEILDPAIEVQVKGTKIVLKGAEKKDVSLAPGNHVLIVTRGDFTFETKSLVLKRGDTVTARVELLDGEIQVVAAGRDILREKVVHAGGERVVPVAAAAVVYLDDMQETSWNGAALGKHGNADHNRPIVWLRKQPEHSLFTHPRNNETARLTYALNGKYDEFRATIGVLAKPLSRLTFRVWADDKQIWESPPQTTAQTGTDVRVSVRGAQFLRLEVQCPGSLLYAHAVWIEPRLTSTTEVNSQVSNLDSPWQAKIVADGGVSKVADPPSPAITPPGASPLAAADYALRFADAADQVDTSDAKLQTRDRFTVEGWFTPRDPLPRGGAEASLVFLVHPCWLSVRNGPQGIKWALGGPTSRPAPTIYSSGKVVAGERSHVALTRGPAGVSFFVNGFRQGESLPIVFFAPVSRLCLCVPPDPSARVVAYYGDIDEIRVSTAVRYQENFTPQQRFEPDADTLALYHCDEGQGETLHDASPNQHHGTIVGAKWVRVEGPLGGSSGGSGDPP